MSLDFPGSLERVLKRSWTASALSPLLWLNALISFPALVSAVAIKDSFRWALFSVAVVVVGYTLHAYHTLKKKNPRLLQSEGFQLEMEKLDLIGEKGGPIDIDPVEIPLGQEPARLAAPRNEEGASRE